MKAVHVHLHQHSDPAQVAALERIAIAIERVADQNDISGRLPQATARLNASNQRLATALAANPDPDPTD